MPKIVPNVLKSLRNQIGWSQETLSVKSNVAKKTIQRIEAGLEDDRVRGSHGNTLHRLAKALGQPVEVLTGQTPLPSALPEPPKQFTEVMRETLGATSNLNFDLVEARYGVTAEEVVQVAPLLFAMFAENARKLKSPISAPANGEKDLEELQREWRDAVSGDAVPAIRKVNVFGEAESSSYWNPFVELLDRELTEAGDAAAGSLLMFEMGATHRWHALLPGNRVPYVEVCPTDLDRLTCLNPEARFALKMGQVRLGDIPKELLAANRGIERVNWILTTLASRKPPTAGSPGTE